MKHFPEGLVGLKHPRSIAADSLAGIRYPSIVVLSIGRPNHRDERSPRIVVEKSDRVSPEPTRYTNVARNLGGIHGNHGWIWTRGRHWQAWIWSWGGAGLSRY